MGRGYKSSRGGCISNPNIKYIVGNTYGRLTVISDDGSRVADTGSVAWLCRCSCGATTHRTGAVLKRSPNASCGCYNKDRMSGQTYTRKHGMSNTRVYLNWVSMKRRCTDPKHKDYRYYGASGITVDEDWFNFNVFYADMGDPPKGCSLDRVDNTKGYSRVNCRWASHTQQMNNTRRNKILIKEGVSKTMAEWARDPELISMGINYYTIRGRKTVCGWSDHKTLTTPHKNWRK